MLTVAGQPLPIPELLALGACVGYLAGLFGIGGGFMLTPMLNLVFGIPYPVAVGSGLCQMIGTAASAYRKHRRLDNGDAKFGVLMIGGSVLGVDAGTHLLVGFNRMGFFQFGERSVPVAKLILSALYILLLLSVAFQFLYRNFQIKGGRSGISPGAEPEALRPPLTRLRLPPYVDLPSAGLRRVSLPIIVYVGFAVGVLSGLMGIGGGVALMPILVYGLGFSVHTAAGTGLLPLLVTASIGTAAHAIHGHIHLGLVAILMLGSTLGAQLGALTALSLSAERLWGGFVAVVVITALALLWDLVRMLYGG